MIFMKNCNNRKAIKLLYPNVTNRYRGNHGCVPESSEVTEKDLNRLSSFMNNCSKLFVITGAGISTESGIKDYRSEKVGLYATSKQRPIQYQEFLNKTQKRKRYWARNYVGWPIFSSYEPNFSHYFFADLERYGNLHWMVTQNVDSLHTKAGSMKLTELHGCAANVGCLGCEYKTSRDDIQKKLDQLNENRLNTSLLEQAPDGDVIVPDEFVENFKMVDCPQCNGILKPEVVFFGDNVTSHVKELCHNKLAQSDGLLVVGSSLQVFSSYRFIIAANKMNIPIAILNIGCTRGDKNALFRLPVRAGDILPKLSLKLLNSRKL